MLSTEQWNSKTMTPKEKMWQQYYAAIRGNNQAEAQRLLRLIHKGPIVNHAARPGKCGRCSKKFKQ